MGQSRLTGRTLRFALLGACLAPLVLQSARSGQPAGAQTPALHLPELQVSGVPQAGSAAWARGLATEGRPSFAPHRLASQQGFGNSVIEAWSLDDQDGDLELAVAEKRTGLEAASLVNRLNVGSATTIDLARLVSLDVGDYAAWLRSDVRIGAVARTRWGNGTTTAYRAPEAASSLVLPLFIANVLGSSTVFAVQNTSQANPNEITVSILDNEDGSRVQVLTQRVDPGQTASWDTFLDRSLFSPPAMANNMHDGYIGSLRIGSFEPAASVAYGEPLEGKGSSAYLARPASAARPLQFLPVVRSGQGGDSIIGIANVQAQAIEVTVEYRAATGDPEIPGEVTRQSFGIGPSGTAILDLSDRDRGTVPRPALGAFRGSAVIRASAPVLAALIEDRREGGRVDSIAAYNAFGPQDFGNRLVVPVIRRADAFATTAFAVYNPGGATANATLELHAADGHVVEAPRLQVPAGETAWLSLDAVPEFPVGKGHAIVSADRALAVLAYDERDTKVPAEPQAVNVTIVEIMDSGVEGSARLAQNGSAVDVTVRLDEGRSSMATINEGTCSYTPGEERYVLNDVENGSSFTQIPNLPLTDLATGSHAIRIFVEGPRGRWHRACGIIPYLLQPHDADMSAVEALVIESAEPIAPTTAPPTQPPEATPTPGTVPSATPGTQPPSATPRPTEPRSRILLPITRKGE